MTTDVRVAWVGPEDAALVHRLMVAAFAEYRDALDPPTGALAESVAEVARAIAAGAAAVAWIGDEPAGTVRAHAEPDHLYVGRLAVLPAFRRSGVASALMAAAEAEAAARGLREVRVEVRTALPGNVAFFARRGYAHRETRPHPRHPSATSELLAKAVTPLA